MKNKMRELSEEEVKNYKELGTATGTFEVCLHMANKHVPNFPNRVVGFRIEKDGMAEKINKALEEAGLDKEESINVTFYEEKEEELEITFIPTLHKGMKEFYSSKTRPN